MTLLRKKLAKPYVGRFAPSPTGALHLGSLLTATASYLQARVRHGRWLIRIEDIDPLRQLPWSVDSILKTLERYGFTWDGDILYQNDRIDVYSDALKQLENKGLTYTCSCSRKQIEAMAAHGLYGWIYPGVCRNSARNKHSTGALRIVTNDQPVMFTDTHYGYQSQKLESEIGDFVVKRADGYIAYLLAVTVDDHYQGITEIVRGADLLSVTARQLYLHRLLYEKNTVPEFFHLPLVVNQQGEKLSKQTTASPPSLDRPVPELVKIMRMLGQEPPGELISNSLNEFWTWAVQNWNPEKIPRVQSVAP